MATILVLAHELDGFHARHYLLEGLFAHWQSAGHQVVVKEGTERLPRAEVAILHVDLTVVPKEYADAARTYPAAVNARSVDASKRRVSANLVRPGDPWKGPVIVKTDANCGGLGEALHWQRRSARGEDPGPPLPLMQGRYPIFPSSTDVPDVLWNDRAFVVERFLPERDARGFYVRSWVFLGDRERCNRMLGRDPIVKAADVVERTPCDVPDAIRAERTRLALDYGKIDFVIHDGAPVLLDVSRTPTLPPHLRKEIEAGMAHLAPGIDDLLARGRAGRTSRP